MNEERVPDGFKKLEFCEVFVGLGQIVVLGTPGDDHDCDKMGCGSLDHVILIGRVETGEPSE